jgi:ABC-2 type transport system ATP-binding protein
MTPVLSLQQLSKAYGSLRALEQVSFEVPADSIFGILGPNGSGKTTLLATALDVLKPSSGHYLWFGEAGSHEVRRRIGTLLETPNFYPYLSARDNLKISAAIKGCPLSDVDRVLELAGLFQRSGSLFRTFSLGMRQRLALAAAMLGDPDVLVLDEPTNGLDPAGIADIRKLIRDIAASGRTIIMASHLLDEVEKVCSHVAILKKGKLLAAGAVGDILAKEEVFEVAAPEVDGLLSLLSAHPGVKSVDRLGDTLQVLLSQPLRGEDLNRYCFEHGFTLSLLHAKKQSLELKFMELTGS